MERPSTYIANLCAGKAKSATVNAFSDPSLIGYCFTGTNPVPSKFSKVDVLREIHILLKTPLARAWDHSDPYLLEATLFLTFFENPFGSSCPILQKKACTINSTNQPSGPLMVIRYNGF